MRKIIKFIFLVIFFVLSQQSNSNAQIPFEEDHKIEIPFDTISTIDEIKRDSIEIKYLNGIDVSYYQYLIAWDSVKKENIAFAIIKSSEGIDLTDIKFKRNWGESKRVGITRGAYHFFRPHVSGKLQAELYLKTVTFEVGDILPVLDVEYIRAYRKTHRSVYLKNFNKFVDEVYKKTGSKPIIYTTANFFNRYYAPYLDTHDYILWIASYRDISGSPHDVLGFKVWTLWQYTSKGRVKGIGNGNVDVDMNIFNGKDLSPILFKK